MSTSASLPARFSSREYPRGMPEARAARNSARRGPTNGRPSRGRCVDPSLALLHAEWSDVARAILNRRPAGERRVPHAVPTPLDTRTRSSRRSSEAT